MSIEYDIYLKNHVAAVQHGFSWLITEIPTDIINDIFPNLKTFDLKTQLANHDASKYSLDEYHAYDRYFYKDGKDSYDGRLEFDYAWLHHLRNNPHHWQYWVLLEDDGSGRPKPLEMSDNYIFEMICDWWSFSWRNYLEALSKGESSNPIKHLYEVFDWYDDHKTKMYLGEKTRQKVEKILDAIRDRLDSIETLENED